MGAEAIVHLDDDVGGVASGCLLIDLPVEVVVAEVELKVQPSLDLDLAGVGSTLSVHPAAEHPVGLDPRDHVGPLKVQ